MQSGTSGLRGKGMKQSTLRSWGQSSGSREAKISHKNPFGDKSYELSHKL